MWSLKHDPIIIDGCCHLSNTTHTQYSARHIEQSKYSLSVFSSRGSMGRPVHGLKTELAGDKGFPRHFLWDGATLGLLLYGIPLGASEVHNQNVLFCFLEDFSN